MVKSIHNFVLIVAISLFISDRSFGASEDLFRVDRGKFNSEKDKQAFDISLKEELKVIEEKLDQRIYQKRYLEYFIFLSKSSFSVTSSEIRNYLSVISEKILKGDKLFLLSHALLLDNTDLPPIDPKLLETEKNMLPAVLYISSKEFMTFDREGFTLSETNQDKIELLVKYVLNSGSMSFPFVCNNPAIKDKIDKNYQFNIEKKVGDYLFNRLTTFHLRISNIIDQSTSLNERKMYLNCLVKFNYILSKSSELFIDDTSTIAAIYNVMLMKRMQAMPQFANNDFSFLKAYKGKLDFLKKSLKEPKALTVDEKEILMNFNEKIFKSLTEILGGRSGRETQGQRKTGDMRSKSMNDND